MLSEFLVEHCTMRLAQGDCGRVSTKALPQSFNKAEPLFNGQSQNRCDLGLTHG
jgi:hypothetical protein